MTSWPSCLRSISQASPLIAFTRHLANYHSLYIHLHRDCVKIRARISVQSRVTVHAQTYGWQLCWDLHDELVHCSTLNWENIDKSVFTFKVFITFTSRTYVLKLFNVECYILLKSFRYKLENIYKYLANNFRHIVCLSNKTNRQIALNKHNPPSPGWGSCCGVPCGTDWENLIFAWQYIAMFIYEIIMFNTKMYLAIKNATKWQIVFWSVCCE